MFCFFRIWVLVVSKSHQFPPNVWHFIATFASRLLARRDENDKILKPRGLRCGGKANLWMKVAEVAKPQGRK
ncbi:hypothetical protein Hanom_Chr10g00963111 [Helianthus anomalus]